MLNKMTTRRDMLKVSAGITGAAVIPATILSWDALDAADPRIAAQAAHFRKVLHKHTQGSQAIHRKHVNAFIKRFCERYGLVDYQANYTGLHGEYRLTRLFARSVFREAQGRQGA